MPIIDLGKVVGDPGASMRFRGEWNSESEYFNNSSYIDAVTHNGSLWICKVTNTNQTPAEGTYWGLGAQGMAEENMVFSAYSAFPSVGDENKLYIDNTVNPALMYIWDGSAYVPAGGGGEVAAEDVTYDNASSSLTAQTVQEALDEIAEAENVIKLNQADAYNPDSTYAAGAYCIYDNVLYKANQDISVAEPWTPAHWDATTIAAELKAQAEDISDLNSRIKMASMLVTFESGAVTIPISSLGIDKTPNFFLVQNIYNGETLYTDSFATQNGIDTVIIYGRTGNNQLINGNRMLGFLMIFDS